MGQNELAHFFQQYPDVFDGRDIAVAVSGGPDSMALAHQLILKTKENGIKVHGLTVDHGLRSAAKDEATMVAQWMDTMGMPHAILSWEGDKPEAAIMEAARAARYDLMANYCRANNIGVLFVAHHQDDQAETFLIRLSKGSGLDGLAGMGAIRQYDDALIIARPFLGVSKQELIAYCTAHHLPTVRDPSNEDEEYLRPRLRGSMAALADEGLTSKRLATTAKRLARARQALEQISTEIYEEAVQEKTVAGTILNFTLLHQQPEEIALRVIARAVEELRPDADYHVRMEKLEELFSSLWKNSEEFKPRTLGGCKFTLKHDPKHDKDSQNTALYIEKEHA